MATPEWKDNYPTDLIGNPVETTTAVASLLLSGVMEELPHLRICLVHGGGCAPSLFGRCEHRWRSRRMPPKAAHAHPRRPVPVLTGST